MPASLLISKFEYELTVIREVLIIEHTTDIGTQKNLRK